MYSWDASRLCATISDVFTVQNIMSSKIGSTTLVDVPTPISVAYVLPPVIVVSFTPNPHSHHQYELDRPDWINVHDPSAVVPGVIAVPLDDAGTAPNVSTYDPARTIPGRDGFPCNLIATRIDPTVALFTDPEPPIRVPEGTYSGKLYRAPITPAFDALFAHDTNKWSIVRSVYVVPPAKSNPIFRRAFFDAADTPTPWTMMSSQNVSNVVVPPSRSTYAGYVLFPGVNDDPYDVPGRVVKQFEMTS